MWPSKLRAEAEVSSLNLNFTVYRRGMKAGGKIRSVGSSGFDLYPFCKVKSWILCPTSSHHDIRFWEMLVSRSCFCARSFHQSRLNKRATDLDHAVPILDALLYRAIKLHYRLVLITQSEERREKEKCT